VRWPDHRRRERLSGRDAGQRGAWQSGQGGNVCTSFPSRTGTGRSGRVSLHDASDNFSRPEASLDDGLSPVETPVAMQYESFRLAWDDALRESKLGMMGLSGEETLNLRSLDRSYEVHVEPLGGQDAEPFFVAASLSFRWDALSTARTATREEDTLMMLFGSDGVPKRKTVKPYHRIDIKLNASLMDGRELPMPSPQAWASWAEETMGRLEDIEPLTPEEKVRENKAGNLEILAWHGEPEAKVLVRPGGELRLRAVSIAGFQLMATPERSTSARRKIAVPMTTFVKCSTASGRRSWPGCRRSIT